MALPERPEIAFRPPTPDELAREGVELVEPDPPITADLSGARAREWARKAQDMGRIGVPERNPDFARPPLDLERTVGSFEPPRRIPSASIVEISRRLRDPVASIEDFDERRDEYAEARLRQRATARERARIRGLEKFRESRKFIGPPTPEGFERPRPPKPIRPVSTAGLPARNLVDSVLSGRSAASVDPKWNAVLDNMRSVVPLVDGTPRLVQDRYGSRGSPSVMIVNTGEGVSFKMTPLRWKNDPRSLGAIGSFSPEAAPLRDPRRASKWLRRKAIKANAESIAENKRLLDFRMSNLIELPERATLVFETAIARNLKGNAKILQRLLPHNFDGSWTDAMRRVLERGTESDRKAMHKALFDAMDEVQWGGPKGGPRLVEDVRKRGYTGRPLPPVTGSPGKRSTYFDAQGNPLFDLGSGDPKAAEQINALVNRAAAGTPGFSGSTPWAKRRQLMEILDAPQVFRGVSLDDLLSTKPGGVSDSLWKTITSKLREHGVDTVVKGRKAVVFKSGLVASALASEVTKQAESLPRSWILFNRGLEGYDPGNFTVSERTVPGAPSDRMPNPRAGESRLQYSGSYRKLPPAPGQPTVFVPEQIEPDESPGMKKIVASETVFRPRETERYVSDLGPRTQPDRMPARLLPVPSDIPGATWVPDDLDAGAFRRRRVGLDPETRAMREELELRREAAAEHHATMNADEIIEEQMTMHAAQERERIRENLRMRSTADIEQARRMREAYVMTPTDEELRQGADIMEPVVAENAPPEVKAAHTARNANRRQKYEDVGDHRNVAYKRMARLKEYQSKLEKRLTKTKKVGERMRLQEALEGAIRERESLADFMKVMPKLARGGVLPLLLGGVLIPLVAGVASVTRDEA